MKILRIIESMDPSYGGPCQGIRNSIPEMDKLNTDNYVASIDDKNTEWAYQDNFKIFKLGPGKGPWGYTSNLVAWLKENLASYDVIIVHGLWQYYGYAVRKTINLLKKENKKTPKFFIMPHGMLDPYFQKAPDRKIKALRNSLFWKLVEKKTLNDADGILFTCQEELVLARETFAGYRPQKEINVGYGILPPAEIQASDIIAFKEHCGLDPNEDYFLFLSRIHPKKGLLNLVKAYASFEGTNRLLPKLVIAGPGMDSDFGKNIDQLVQNNNFLKNNIIYAGMVTGNAKWAAFTGAKAFILPSHQENFGIAVVEALACHCPVLISNKVNIWREIVEGNGGVVTEDTYEGTRQLLGQGLELSLEEIEEMRKNAYNVYQTHFTVKQAAKKLSETLKSQLL
ncbi:glycosyltransferase [Euzebyella saccharophila]|uniref:Glycosyltransferase n=1 Tax=Euzebyella saccharophila TaxID=679664 RepID=A0ABV8JVC4_9FLAO|nr:glycosyltransferase [Euzebyella saccharophila]